MVCKTLNLKSAAEFLEPVLEIQLLAPRKSVSANFSLQKRFPTINHNLRGLLFALGGRFRLTLSTTKLCLSQA